MRRFRLTLAALAVCLPPVSAAADLPPLHENRAVLAGFYAIGLADELRKNCDRLEPRLLTAYNFLKSMEQNARSQGYTEAQIQALLDNKAEKEKLRARIRADLAARGATPQTPEGYCTVGLEEIAKDSTAGRLLRAK